MLRTVILLVLLLAASSACADVAADCAVAAVPALSPVGHESAGLPSEMQREILRQMGGPFAPSNFVPEPGVLVVLLVGGLFLLRRR